MSDLVAEVLAQVVTLGDTPTDRELQLGEAVTAHVASRPPPEICPTCHGTGRA